MNTETIHKPGSLVRYRNRKWIVLPSDNDQLIYLKPLGGAEQEITAVFKPMAGFVEEKIEPDTFPEPTPDEIGNFATAKLLFDAARLSFRNAGGPFRAMGKLSFRPRSYQLVPLVMALKQTEAVRMLIGDDVGIGKTVEALIILKELMERGEVKRFAIITPPHLCEQWQQELKDKLDIDAEIIRSSTAAKLDRQLPDDRSIFHHIPYQVISIDYIKFYKRKAIFLNDCPELVIVDEAHTCSLPAGAKSKSQQMRYSLLFDIASNQARNLLLLTATPHSGKDDEFKSILGLLKPEFDKLNFENLQQPERRKLARYFIQRKRENIKRWLKQVTPFPERDSKEIAYNLGGEYHDFYHTILAFARGIHLHADENKARIRYWAALALLRGVMSSPAAGEDMLKNRKAKFIDDEELAEIQLQDNPVIENISSDSDSNQAELIEISRLPQHELDEINALSQQIVALKGTQNDKKVAKAVDILKQWTKEGYQPIVFCKYIATAKYVGEILKENLPKNTDIRIITSEFADEQRREQIDLMGKSDKRILVATDCLSEGINLQEYFTAVLHYDLPWNPNRIEQREGRVDRYGQDAPTVKTYLLWGADNPIDEIVLKVLINKVRDIQKSTGVSISIGEENQSIMDTIMKEVLLENEPAEKATQLSMFEDQISNELETARQKAENLRSIFAHESVKPENIEADLLEVDEAIGDVQSVENFVVNALVHLRDSIKKDDKGFVLSPTNLPPHIKAYFKQNSNAKISFESPTPKGYQYIGRNHKFVEQLCQYMLSLAFDENKKDDAIARVAEIQTSAVEYKTTLIMFRVRNVIKEVAKNREVIAEEMYLWGYSGSGENRQTLSYAQAKKLLQEARSLQDFSPERQKQDLAQEISRFEELKPQFHQLAVQRAENLVKAHGRFKELVGGRRYEKATPVLPPDIMGVYILMPKPKMI